MEKILPPLGVIAFSLCADIFIAMFFAVAEIIAIALIDRHNRALQQKEKMWSMP